MYQNVTNIRTISHFVHHVCLRCIGRFDWLEWNQRQKAIGRNISTTEFEQGFDSCL